MTGVNIDEGIEDVNPTPIIDEINKYKLIAVVDAQRTFTQNDVSHEIDVSVL